MKNQSALNDNCKEPISVVSLLSKIARSRDPGPFSLPEETLTAISGYSSAEWVEFLAIAAIVVKQLGRSRGYAGRGAITALRNWVQLLEETQRHCKDWTAADRLNYLVLSSRAVLLAHGVIEELPGKDTPAALRALIKERSHLLFDTITEAISECAETELVLVQHECFNDLRFSSVENRLCGINDIYGEVLESVRLSVIRADLTAKKDSLHARLLGTTGQALGFMADLAAGEDKRQSLYMRAVKALEEDVRLTESSSDEWVQGMNYLTALHWKFGTIEESFRHLMRSLQGGDEDHDGSDFNSLTLLTGSGALVGDGSASQYRWLLLNQLRILSRAVHLRKSKPHTLPVAALEGLAQGPVDYPGNLISKWAFYLLYAAGGVDDKALMKQAKRLKQPRSALVLELMRAHEIASLAALSSNREISGEIRRGGAALIEQLLKKDSFNTTVGGSHWVSFLKNGDLPASGVYGLTAGLPYYYS